MWKQGTRQPWTTAFIGKDLFRKKIFDCLYCVGQKTVKVELAKRSGKAHLYCRKCRASWDCTINYLEEECDVFDRWEKACREAATKEVRLEKNETQKQTEVKPMTAPTFQTSSKVRKILDGKRLDLNKFVEKKPKKNVGTGKEEAKQVETVGKVISTASKKRRPPDDKQAAHEHSVTKRTRIEKATLEKEVVQLTQEDLVCLLDASSDEEDDDEEELERELELALAAEAERDRILANKKAATRVDVGEAAAAAATEEKMGEVSHKFTKLQSGQQLGIIKEQSSMTAVAESQVSKNRARSYESLFGSCSDGLKITNDDCDEREAEPDQQSLDINDGVLTQNINANFAALHAAFGLEQDAKVTIEVLKVDLSESEEMRQDDSRKLSSSSDSLFGDSE